MNLEWRLTRALDHIAVFEVAVAEGGFTRAAEKLGTTQPTVSRHVAALEGLLGVELFRRLHHRVEPTEAGAELYDAVRLGLEHIRQAAERIAAREAPETVAIACTYGFAHLWLMPRFSSLQARLKGRELRLITTDTRAEHDLARIDFALRFGRGEWRDGESRKLFGERLTPVCAPAFARERFGGARGVTARALAAAPLIHDRDQGRHAWMTWRQWLARHGVERPPAARDVGLDNYALTLQAAREGRGVALAWSHLAEEPLASGALVALSGLSVSTDQGYHLAFRRGHPLADTVCGWFQEMVARQEAGEAARA